MGAASTTPRAQASNWALPSSCNLKSTGFGTWGCNVGATGRKTGVLRGFRVKVWQRVGLIRAGLYWYPNPKPDPRRTLPQPAQIAEPERGYRGAQLRDLRFEHGDAHAGGRHSAEEALGPWRAKLERGKYWLFISRCWVIASDRTR